MAIVFAVRGDSVDARYAEEGKTPYIYLSGAGVARVTTRKPGINGVNSIDLNNDSAVISKFVRPIEYFGELNSPSDRPRSYLVRVMFPVLNQTLGIFMASGETGIPTTGLWLGIDASGQLTGGVANDIYQRDTFVTSGLALTASTWHDVLLCWDGTTGANKLVIYVDGTQVLLDTMIRGLTTPYTAAIRKWCNRIILGYGSGVGTRETGIWIDEFVAWDEFLTSATVTLTSGSGSLSGAARTAYVAVDAYDGEAVPTGGGGRIVKML